MSIIGSNVLAGASGSGVEAYEIEQSLRFEANASTEMQKNFSTESNRTTSTTSVWIKRGKLDVVDYCIWSARETANYWEEFTIYSDGSIYALAKYNGATRWNMRTSALLRDPSAWYHLVYVRDTSNATQADRIRIYVNGERVTSWATQTEPASSGLAGFLGGNFEHKLGKRAGYDDETYDGYMAEFHYLDGTASNADSFGELDSNGVWRPIEYTGDSYGTNGLYIKFDETADNGIRHDHSGNGNHFASSSGFTTSGAGTDVMSDTPTTNWCTLNPLTQRDGNAPQNGNLEARNTSSDGSCLGTVILEAGKKYYFEGTYVEAAGTGSQACLGITSTLSKGAFRKVGSSTGDFGFDFRGSSGTPQAKDEGTNTTYGSRPGNGEVCGIAIDLENGKLYTHKSNNYYNSGSPSAGTGAVITGIPTDQNFLVHVSTDSGSSNRTEWVLNFGQREFAYPPGTASATDYFNCVTYTGNGSSGHGITGVGFQPDFVWIKNRDVNDHHAFYDVIRGANYYLGSNRTNGSTLASNSLTAFDSDGFTVSTSGLTNFNGQDYVAWCWKAGGTASDNTDGNVTSSVSVNQDAGFSVVKYTSSTSTKPLNVGHGLGKKPDFILTKNLDATASWGGYHSSVGATKSMFINSTGSGTVSGDYFNDTEPTSSVFTVFDSNNTHSYGTTNEFIAYCWTAKDGVSKFGSYTGTGSSTGPFIECGFKPRLVICKRTDANSNWFMYDTIRGTNNKLYAEGDYDENEEDGGSTTSNTILSLSTGFQMTSGNGSNASGGTYIFMAWAETFSADADYKALNTSSITAPEVKDGGDYFDTVLWTGNETARTISLNSTFTPDFIWTKNRTNNYNHSLQDVVRGFGTSTKLNSNTATNENASNTEPQAGYIDSVDAGSFDIDASPTAGWEHNNESGSDFVAWAWLAGGSGVTNTDGTATNTVTVSASPKAGFSIVKYSGQSTNFTWGHGLGVAPDMVFITGRDNSSGWSVYHSALGATKRLSLNGDGGAETMGYFQNTAPTDTVFSVSTNGGTGANGVNYIAYCFAEIEGYSKVGSWVGNLNANGPFIHTNFAPSFVMWKRGGTDGWVMKDVARSPYNEMDELLLANVATSESSAQGVDFLSNGFKIRTNSGASNASGDTYYYIAFASNPFGGVGVSPATAR